MRRISVTSSQSLYKALSLLVKLAAIKNTYCMPDVVLGALYMLPLMPPS